MERKEGTKKLVAGIFFIVGIILTIYVILLLGKDKGLTESKFQVTVYFRDVGGLIEGAPVRLAGVNVGTVSMIDFLEKASEGRRVRVILNIYEKFKEQFIGKNAKFSVQTEGILGEKLIIINIMEGGRSLNFDKPVLGEDPIDVQELAEVFAMAAESFTKTSQTLSEIDMQELSDVVGETAESWSITAKGINKVLEEMHDISIKSKRLIDRIEQRIIDGDLFKVF